MIQWPAIATSSTSQTSGKVKPGSLLLSQVPHQQGRSAAAPSAVAPCGQLGGRGPLSRLLSAPATFPLGSFRLPVPSALASVAPHSSPYTSCACLALRVLCGLPSPPLLSQNSLSCKPSANVASSSKPVLLPGLILPSSFSPASTSLWLFWGAFFCINFKLRYNPHTMKSTPLKDAVQWLIYLQSCAPISAILISSPPKETGTP